MPKTRKDQTSNEPESERTRGQSGRFGKLLLEPLITAFLPDPAPQLSPREPPRYRNQAGLQPPTHTEHTLEPQDLKARQRSVNKSVQEYAGRLGRSLVR